MPKTVSATEAKNNFGSIAEWVTTNDDAVVVENRGSETVVIISKVDYAQFQELREQRRRSDLLQRLRAIRSQGTGYQDGLTEEESMDLVVQSVNEIRAERGAIKSGMPTS